jgi:hypothetical protein
MPVADVAAPPTQRRRDDAPSDVFRASASAARQAAAEQPAEPERPMEARRAPIGPNGAASRLGAAEQARLLRARLNRGRFHRAR